MKIMSIDLIGKSLNGRGAVPYWESLNDVVNGCTTIKTGKFEDIIINQGGLQHRTASQEIKDKFKNEVHLSLITSAHIDGFITGRIEGHLAEGILRDAALHFQCEEGHKIIPLF